MNDQKNSEFGENSAQTMSAERWEKIQAEGKWLWIFKRGAVWTTMILFFYGVGAMVYPAFFNFQTSQFLIISGMLIGFLINSILEWSKMEEVHQEN